MSYRAAMYGLEQHGIASGPARIICDDCGAELQVKPRGMSGPPAWLLNRKAPPGWSCDASGDTRIDRCPRCVAEHGKLRARR